MKNISAEVSIFCLRPNWIHLVTCSKTEFRELHCWSRCALDKIFEIYTSDRCSQGWSGQKSCLACGNSKKENWRTNKPIFETRALNPFHGQKTKDKFFSDGKSRGQLLARAALKTNMQKTWRTTKSCRLVSPDLQSIFKRALRTLWRNIRKMLSDCWGECDLKTNETEENR